LRCTETVRRTIFRISRETRNEKKGYKTSFSVFRNTTKSAKNELTVYTDRVRLSFSKSPFS